MPGAWPEEADEVAVSIETKSSAYENDESWLKRIDFRGLYVRHLSIKLELRG